MTPRITDRAGLRTAVEKIRSVIQEELESHRGSVLEDNYARGIEICDELLADIAMTLEPHDRVAYASNQNGRTDSPSRTPGGARPATARAMG